MARVYERQLLTSTDVVAVAEALLQIKQSGSRKGAVGSLLNSKKQKLPIGLATLAQTLHARLDTLISSPDFYVSMLPADGKGGKQNANASAGFDGSLTQQVSEVCCELHPFCWIIAS